MVLLHILLLDLINARQNMVANRIMGIVLGLIRFLLMLIDIPLLIIKMLLIIFIATATDIISALLMFFADVTSADTGAGISYYCQTHSKNTTIGER